MENNIAFPITGGIAGAGVYSTIGGIGIIGGFGGIGIGFVGLTTAGTVVGSAIYGAVEGIGNGDRNAVGAVGLGAVGGAGVASTFGGVGIGVSGSAFGIGIGSMTAMGGIFGLGIYGLARMFADSGTKEPIAETFNRMEENISDMEAYNQALMELNPLFADLIWEQQFSELEIEDELKMLEAQIEANARNCSKFQSQGNENTYHTKLNSSEIELPKQFSWQLSTTILGHTNTINSFAIKDNILATASDDNTISLWNIETGNQIYSFFGYQEVRTVAFYGRSIAAGGFDRAITSWELENKALERIISKSQNFNSHNDVVYALISNNKEDLLISGSADRTIKVWNSVTGSLKFTLDEHTDSVTTLAISPCDRFLITGSVDRTIKTWDLINPLAEPHTIDGHSYAITALAITSDGKYFISAFKNSGIKVWCMKTKKNLATFGKSIDNISSIAVSPDNKVIAVGNNDIVQLWNLETKQLLQSINACSPVIFNPSGKYLITGNDYNRIQVWQFLPDNSHPQHQNYTNAEWWQILGVSKNSSATDIKTAYYNLARQYHPDINSTKKAKEMMSIINRAYQESQIK